MKPGGFNCTVAALFTLGCLVVAPFSSPVLATHFAPPTTTFARANYLNPNTGRFWTKDTYSGNNSDPISLHKYLYAHNDPVNGIDPSGHFFTAIGQLTVSFIQHNSRTLEGVVLATFKARALQTLTFKIGAWAIVSATTATTIGGVVAVVAAGSTSEEDVNEEIETQIEQAKRQRKKLRFFHYSPRTYEERGTSMFPGSFAALRGNMYYYEARGTLGIGDPKWVYPVDVDSLVDLVVPRGRVTAGGFGFGESRKLSFQTEHNQVQYCLVN